MTIQEIIKKIIQSSKPNHNHTKTIEMTEVAKDVWAKKEKPKEE